MRGKKFKKIGFLVVIWGVIMVFQLKGMAAPSFSDLFPEVHHPSTTTPLKLASHGAANVTFVVSPHAAHMPAHAESYAVHVHVEPFVHVEPPQPAPTTTKFYAQAVFSPIAPVFSSSKRKGRLYCNQGELDCI